VSQARLVSLHSKAQLDDDSNEIEVSLEPSTVAPRSNSCSKLRVSSAPAALVVQGMFIVALFGEHCFLAWEAFHRRTSPLLKVWVRTLNKRAGLPHHSHRATYVKIMRTLRTLVQTKLHGIIKEHAKLLIAPHSGSQSDIWSEKSMRQSFFCI
jgi:hypothetical protein